MVLVDSYRDFMLSLLHTWVWQSVVSGIQPAAAAWPCIVVAMSSSSYFMYSRVCYMGMLFISKVWAANGPADCC
jgi:hypothetical protein